MISNVTLEYFVPYLPGECKRFLSFGAKPILRDCRGRFKAFFRAPSGASAKNEIGVLAASFDQMTQRIKIRTTMESADLMDALDDDQSFLQSLTRLLAAYSPLGDIGFEFSAAGEAIKANIGAERLEDI
jgi:hypothetical protein